MFPTPNALAFVFTPQPFKAMQYCFQPSHTVEWLAEGSVRQEEGEILSGLYLRNYGVFEVHRWNIAWECSYATPWCDLDLTFDLVIVLLIFTILSGLYLKNHKV